MPRHRLARHAPALLVAAAAALLVPSAATSDTSGTSATSGDAAPRVTVIRAARLLDLAAGETIPDATVVVRGDAIEAVGRTGEVAVPPGPRGDG